MEKTIKSTWEAFMSKIQKACKTGWAKAVMLVTKLLW